MRLVLFVVGGADRAATEDFAVARMPHEAGHLDAPRLRRFIAGHNAGHYFFGHDFFQKRKVAAVVLTSPVAAGTAAAARSRLHFPLPLHGLNAGDQQPVLLQFTGRVQAFGLALDPQVEQVVCRILQEQAELLVLMSRSSVILAMAGKVRGA